MKVLIPPFGRQVLVATGLVVLAFLALFWPTFGWMVERFEAPDSYYSHGWLVPLASAWLIWQRRAELTRLPLRSSYGGLLLLVPSVLLHVAAVWARLHFVSGFMLVTSVWGLVWTLWGRQAAWALRFPLAFLLFMVPLPGVVLIGLSFRLKLAAAWLAAKILTLCGIAASQAGSIIRLPGLIVSVDDTCSGLRSLISLTALSTLWTTLLPGASAWRKAALVAASIPIALVANMVRILVLTMVALVWGVPASEGFIHYGSGMVIFAVALLALAWLGRVLAPAGGRA
jgi:exosortase